MQQSQFAQKWLNGARWAASGGNAQPWDVEFAEKDDGLVFRLSLNAKYARNPSAMDAGGAASVMALGCFAKTLEIFAGLDNFKLYLKTWDSPRELKNKDSSQDSVQDFWSDAAVLYFRRDLMTTQTYNQTDILNRRTDRHRYKKIAVPIELQSSIKEIISKYEMLNSYEFASDKKKLSASFEELGKIRWQNEQLLTSLLSEISFADEEVKIKDKIPASQLGATSMDVSLLRLMRRFPWLGILFRIGFHKIPVQKDISNYTQHCDRMLFLEAKEYNFVNCFELGRCFQEVWLETNRRGMSFQPLGLPLIALAFWQNIDFLKFTKSQKNSITQLTEDFQRVFSINLKNPVMGFRIGWPLKASDKPLRKDLVGQHKPEIFDFVTSDSKYVF